MKSKSANEHRNKFKKFCASLVSKFLKFLPITFGRFLVSSFLFVIRNKGQRNKMREAGAVITFKTMLIMFDFKLEVVKALSCCTCWVDYYLIEENELKIFLKEESVFGKSEVDNVSKIIGDKYGFYIAQRYGVIMFAIFKYD